MKKVFVAMFLLASFSSCRKMNADHLERKAGVAKVCPKCNFVTNYSHSSTMYYAVDTSVQPNIIYQVDFKAGGWFYSASDVDHLIRIN